MLEIGPGIGTLTEALLKTAGQVVAIERDADLIEVLEQTCAPWSDAFTLISADALTIHADQLPFAPNKLVANLPYAVAATLVLDFFERIPSLESATVMVQAEVADRMSAKLGTKNYGAYTVKLHLLAHPVNRFSVSEGNFFPPPRVKSAVIRLDRNEEQLDPALLHATMIMADAAFENRRKTIANSMKRYFERTLSAESSFPQIGGRSPLQTQGTASSNPLCDHLALLPHLLDQAGIDPKLRGEVLTVDDFLRLGGTYLHLMQA